MKKSRNVFNKSFVHGMASVVSLFGANSNYSSIQRGYEHDAVSLHNDWINVGNAIKGSMDKYAKKNKGK